MEKLLDIQKREQIQTAITKLQVQGTSDDGDEVRAVARSGDSGQALDQMALSKTLEAFRSAPDDKQLAEFVENPDLKAIMRARASLSDEDLEKLRKVMESLYPDAFLG